MITQIASGIGAVLILTGYSALQSRKVTESSLLYLGANFVGGALLFFSACYTGQIGFIVLEGAWVLVTVYGFYKSRQRLSS